MIALNKIDEASIEETSSVDNSESGASSPKQSEPQEFNENQNDLKINVVKNRQNNKSFTSAILNLEPEDSDRSLQYEDEPKEKKDLAKGGRRLSFRNLNEADYDDDNRIVQKVQDNKFVSELSKSLIQ